MTECCALCDAKGRRTPADPTLDWESFLHLCRSCAAQMEWRTLTEPPPSINLKMFHTLFGSPR